MANYRRKSFDDLIGRKYNKLTIVSGAEPRISYPPSGRVIVRMVKCKCDCGKEVAVRLNKLTLGHTKSCGCFLKNPHRYVSVVVNGIMIEKEHPLYIVWEGMKNRCYNHNYKNYKNYGGRGIIICDEWKNDFSCFYLWAICNGFGSGLTIDRIDNDGNYEPSNCRWATYKQQNNNRRGNVIIDLNGIKMTKKEACDKYGIKYTTASKRLHSGWSDERTFLTPVRKKIA